MTHLCPDCNHDWAWHGASGCIRLMHVSRDYFDDQAMNIEEARALTEAIRQAKRDYEDALIASGKTPEEAREAAEYPPTNRAASEFPESDLIAPCKCARINPR